MQGPCPALEKQAEAQLCALPSKLLPESSPFSGSSGDPLPPSAQPRTHSRPRPRAPSRPGFLPHYHSPGGHHLARLRAQLSHHARALRPQPALRAHAASGAGADRGGPGGLRGRIFFFRAPHFVTVVLQVSGESYVNREVASVSHRVRRGELSATARLCFPCSCFISPSTQKAMCPCDFFPPLIFFLPPH